ncbi:MULTISPECIES: hypothetical protein [unclassified Moorena]|uniref:hypothetical protein n=1 Tax=unclassified Moorena TaxID=2683338 RepID=UPI0025EDD58B|nr:MULTISPECIES: hypothetical protein [unclassified Moorena]
MSEQNAQVCPICGVRIIPGGQVEDRVIFKVGPVGTRAILYQRVCQYVQKPGCINKNP